MFTEIEGEWNDIMAVIKNATQHFTDKGSRTSVVLKADIRPDYTNMMNGKMERLEEAINQKG